MIFASHIFLFWFLPIVLGLYYLLPFRARSFLLVVASYVFYAWWRVDFLVPLVISTFVDYFCGQRIAAWSVRLAAADASDAHLRLARRRRKSFLLLSIITNLGLLGYFKYMNFGVDTLNELLAGFGVEPVSWTRIVLPMGISFYTFQTMSYTLDIYRGQARPVRTFLDFACYVSLFPQLVCGPIVRYQQLDEQLRKRDHTFDKFAKGALLFQLGFAKKILLADSVAVIADGAYSIAEPSFLEAWLGTIAYSFQIYFDFSGYSDMAIGLGLLFGFVFPINFNSPYKATTITDFWRRWHMSLSSWLRDYLYIPLGGNRRGSGRTYFNLATTFVLCGLWHGAAWTFVAWGAYHGVWLIVERVTGRRGLIPGAPPVVQRLLTYVLVLWGWVFFRAESCDQALHFLGAMVGIGNRPWLSIETFELGRLVLVAFGACAAISWLFPNSQGLAERRPAWLLLGIPVVFCLAVIHLFFKSYTPFLYFQF